MSDAIGAIGANLERCVGKNRLPVDETAYTHGCSVRLGGQMGHSLAGALADVARHLSTTGDVVEGLQLLAERAAEQVPDTDTWVLLGRAPSQRLFATSSMAEAAQHMSGEEGPCHEAVVTGRDVVAASAEEILGRWPVTGGVLVQLGHEALHAIPLAANGQSVGSMLFARRCPCPLGDDELEAARAFAALASLGVTLQQTGEVAAQLQHALDARVAVEQAKGVVAATLGLPMAEGLGVIRRHARDHNRRLAEVAIEIVEGRLRPQDLRTAS
jgi:hypothetical protein